VHRYRNRLVVLDEGVVAAVRAGQRSSVGFEAGDDLLAVHLWMIDQY
jgi:hypothetical protein